MQKVGARPPNTAADMFLESAKPVYDTSVGKISNTAALIGPRENAIIITIMICPVIKPKRDPESKMTYFHGGQIRKLINKYAAA